MTIVPDQSLQHSYNEDLELDTEFENTTNTEEGEKIFKEIEISKDEQPLALNEEDVANLTSFFEDFAFEDKKFQKDFENLTLENKKPKENSSFEKSVLYFLNFISKNVLNAKSEISCQKIIQNLFNCCFVEIQKEKNEKLKEYLLEIYFILFNDKEVNFTKEMNFDFVVEKFHQKIQFIKNIFDEINNIFRKLEIKNLSKKNEFDNQNIQTNELKLQIKELQESSLAGNLELLKLQEKFAKACNFIEELNNYFGYEKLNLKNESEMFAFFSRVKERIEKISVENEKLKSDKSQEKIKNTYKTTIKNLEDQLQQSKEEAFKLKSKNTTYKNLLLKLKSMIYKLKEENENKENEITNQNTLLKFLKYDGDHFSTKALADKIEKTKKMLVDENLPEVKRILREDLVDYQRMYNDLKQLKE